MSSTDMPSDSHVPVRNRLVVRLMVIHVIMAMVAIAIVWLALNSLAGAYMSVLMRRYGVSDSTTHNMFVQSVHRYIIGAGVASLFVGGALSFLMMRKALRPLMRMAELTGRIAAGDYSVRVPDTTNDEVGRLARAFNTMADSLQRIEQLRKRMMIDVAHELRTPLTNVRGYIEALHDGVVPASHETYELLEEETVRLASLVEDILKLSHADAARGTLNMATVDIRELLGQVIARFHPAFADRNLRTETELPEAPLLVRADSDKIQQVLTNLLHNACQYNEENGLIRISARAAPGAVVVEIANTGALIQEQDIPFIFERFYRGDKSRSRELGGAGVGLAIVKELVEAHGGTVTAESESRLTVFRFSLPVNN